MVANNRHPSHLPQTRIAATYQGLICFIYMKQVINIKRAYDPAAPDDGFRIYIDRLWPRGLSHETFHYDLWDKEIAPSTDLRKWFHANPQTEWAEFEKQYRQELLSNPVLDNLKKTIVGKPRVTLLYSSHDVTHNNAVVLRDLLLTGNRSNQT